MAPSGSIILCEKHPLVSRFISCLPATSPAEGLALPASQVATRDAIAVNQARCFTTCLYPPTVVHDSSCDCQHLQLSKTSRESGRKSKRRHNSFSVAKDVASGWKQPQPIDVNEVMGTNLDFVQTESIFVWAALQLTYAWEHPKHFTLWGSTTAVMTALRVQKFMGKFLNYLRSMTLLILLL